MPPAASIAEIVQLALSGNEARRCELASRHDSPPELLVLLAGDDLTSVRQAVAENALAPGHADRLLCQDPAVRVRAALALRLGRAAGALMEDELPHRRRAARDALLLLASDADPAVRRALEEGLQAAPAAARALVLAAPGGGAAPAVTEASRNCNTRVALGD